MLKLAANWQGPLGFMMRTLRSSKLGFVDFWGSVQRLKSNLQSWYPKHYRKAFAYTILFLLYITYISHAQVIHFAECLFHHWRWSFYSFSNRHTGRMIDFLTCSLYVHDGVEGGSSWKHRPASGQERGHRSSLPSHYIWSCHLLYHQVDGRRHRPHQEAEGGGSETGGWVVVGVIPVPELNMPPVWLQILMYGNVIDQTCV